MIVNYLKIFKYLFNDIKFSPKYFKDIHFIFL
jgi:hypothetical protein